MVENKKSLSNWLIASDIDGTINNKARQLQNERLPCSILEMRNENGTGNQNLF